MPFGTVVGYVVSLMSLGFVANFVDPEMSSVWMRLCFLALGVGFFGEIAIRGLAPAAGRGGR